MESYQKNRQDLMAELDSDFEKGLDSSTASKRLEKYGENKLEESKRKPFSKKIAEQLLDPMVIVLIIAAGLSAITSDIVEMMVIIAVVVLNAAMSIYQEGKAEDSVEALQKMSSPTAKVIRDGKFITIKSSEIVPGDIVDLETGDIVPADIRILESSNLKIDESSLTGESVAVEKNGKIVYDKDEKREIGDRENMGYSSTIVTYGRGKGVVISTGHETEIGKIASSLSGLQDEQTPLQRKLVQLSKVLGGLVIGVSVVVFLVGLLRGFEILEIFKTAISLAVAAIPEGMTAVVTIVLSMGMNVMASKNAIVKKLLAVETLGTTTVICSDKTGTLTQNEMTVTKAWTGDKEYNVSGTGYGPEGKFTIDGDELKNEGQVNFMFILASLTNDAKIVNEDNTYKCIGDPTEGALVTAAHKLGYAKHHLEDKYNRVDEIPFDSDRKMMTTFHDGLLKDGKILSSTKGAPDLIIEYSSKILINGEVKDFTPELKKKALEKNSEFARQALRVLAYAYKDFDRVPDKEDKLPEKVERDMIFVGLSGMIDPARPEAKAAIKECKSAGITPIMITGDYLDTALAIAKDLGIAHKDDEAIMGKELNDMTDEEIREVVKHKRVFARVSPENKVQIVTALKENGHIAAMTGDGVNDAPAIKKADIGISMGITGTDVAKNTSDVILTDDNFATIVNAVEEGRIIYANIKKFVSFLLSCNIGEVLIIFIAILIGAPVPLTAVQLLFLNLVTDSLPALALGTEKGESDIMEQKPRDKDEPIIDHSMIDNIVVQALAITVATLTAFFVGLNILYKSSPDQVAGAETMAFATLILAELLRSFSVRSFDKTLGELGLFTNMNLIYAVGVSVVLLLLVMFVPFLQDLFELISLSPMAWLVVLLCAFFPFVSGEIHKKFFNK